MPALNLYHLHRSSPYAEKDPTRKENRAVILKNKTKERVVYIDTLNIAAIVGVLFMHHNFNVFSFSNTASWCSSFTILNIFYYAVPLFLMITGATLLGYREKYDTKTYFRKRLLKILVPFAAWMTIMLCWHIFIVKDISASGLSAAGFINLITTSKENSIYYYLFVILGLYITIPLFSPLTKKRYRKVLWYGVIAFIIFNTLIPDLAKLFGVIYNNDLSIQIGNYVPYLFLGYLLSTEKLSRNKRIALYSAGIATLLYRFLMVYFMSLNSGYLKRTILGYSSFHAIIYASAIFVFIKNLPFQNLPGHTKSILAKLAGCSFGIYLCHMLVMHYESSILKHALGLPTISWIWRFLCPLLTYALCVGIVLLLKKIPVVRKIVP